jgi:opacity protein-like surface antigen
MKLARVPVAIALLAATAARADLPMPSTVFIAEGGVSAHGTYSLTAGVAWPSKWQRMSASGLWTASIEASASHWSSRFDGHRHGYTQVALAPVVRYRFDHGRSDWFAEGGVGLSWLDGLYQRDHKRFSTRFNFHDTIGVGFNFGAHREHELSLRLTHVSNAGIKEPNPGENFAQLRYGRNF